MRVAGTLSAMVLTDLALARRLDRAEAMAGARYVEARALAQPEAGAEWIDVGGTYAMFDGVGSPATQTFGLGLFETPANEHFERIETFFSSRGATSAHDVSPLAGVRVYRMLCDRGYRPIENAQVMFMPLQARLPAPESAVRVRIINEHERGIWAQTGAAGWAQEVPDLKDSLADLLLTTANRDAPSFLAELDGQPIATAAYFEHEGVALLAGASTIPAWRNRGAQRALLHARLDYALESGCDLAMIVAEPGSASQRNAERQGFRIGYTRTKWERAATV